MTWDFVRESFRKQSFRDSITPNSNASGTPAVEEKISDLRDFEKLHPIALDKEQPDTPLRKLLTFKDEDIRVSITPKHNLPMVAQQVEHKNKTKNTPLLFIPSNAHTITKLVCNSIVFF